MKITIGNNHTVIELKSIIEEFVEGEGYEVIGLGTNPAESCDYPIYGEKVGRAVADGQADLGVAICDIGMGVSLAANKVKGVRARVCSEPYTVKLSRAHNNSNALAFSARVVGGELTKMTTEAWLDAEFEGGRHERRVNMTTEIKNR